MCGSTEFTRRADDTAETVSNRLMAYYRDTAPLTGYYFCKGNLRSVDGMAPIEQVAQEIGKILSAAEKGALIGAVVPLARACLRSQACLACR